MVCCSGSSPQIAFGRMDLIVDVAWRLLVYSAHMSEVIVCWLGNYCSIGSGNHQCDLEREAEAVAAAAAVAVHLIMSFAGTTDQGALSVRAVVAYRRDWLT